MDFDLIKAVQTGGAVVILMMCLIAYTREWVYSGATVRRMLADKDEQLERERQETRDWKAMALGSVDTGSRLLELAARRKKLDVPAAEP